MSKLVLITASVAVHAGLLLLLGEIRVEEARAATPIQVVEVAPPPEPPPPPPPEPEPEVAPPEPAPKPEPRRAPPPAPAKAAPEPATPAASSFDDVPDFGLALDGAATGGGGLAVPVRPRAPVAAERPTVKQLAAPKVAECSEAASKPKPVSVPQPVYTDAARTAGVEGKVRVELTVDATGRVSEVRVLSGLGHGLDEAALAAARAATFTPAQRCGRAVSATFTISMRFSAG